MIGNEIQVSIWNVSKGDFYSDTYNDSNSWIIDELDEYSDAKEPGEMRTKPSRNIHLSKKTIYNKENFIKQTN